MKTHFIIDRLFASNLEINKPLFRGPIPIVPCNFQILTKSISHIHAGIFYVVRVQASLRNS